MSLIDKLALIGSGVTSSKELSSTITVFRTRKKDCPAILKFDYPGNTQYHKLSKAELAVLLRELSDIQNAPEIESKDET